VEFFSGGMLAHLIEVFGINLILSGDNAVVIAMAVRSLDGANRRRAILWGAAGAILLRLFFAAVVASLLHIPLLQVVGGLLLVWIAWQLVRDSGEDEEKVQAGQSTWEAIRIIIIADAVMSLDNVIALVQAARVEGEVSFPILGIGLLTTIPLVVFGAALLTSLLDRFPVLVYLGAALLVYLAVEMFFADVVTRPYLKPYADVEWVFGLAAAALFVAVAWLSARKTGEAAG